MTTRRRLIAFVLVSGAAVAGCASSGGTTAPPAGPSAASTPTPIASAPVTPPVTGNSGNVRPGYPELAVSNPTGPSITVAVHDPSARAWRIALAGLGAHAGDRLELEVSTGDIGYVAEMRSIVAGRTVETTDLSGMLGEPTVASGGCHPTLQVCFASSGVAGPVDGNGELAMTYELLTPADVEIRGAVAAWTEPFVLGAWRETAPFRTGR